MKAPGVEGQDRQDDPEADQVDRDRGPDGAEARRQGRAVPATSSPPPTVSTSEHHRQLAGQGDRASLAVPQLAILLQQAVDEDAGPEGAEQPARARGGRGRAPSARWSAPSPAAIEPSRVGGKASAKATADRALGSVPSRKRIQPVISKGSPSPGRPHGLSAGRRRSKRFMTSGIGRPAWRVRWARLTHWSGGGMSGGRALTRVGPWCSARSPKAPSTRTRSRSPWTTSAMTVTKVRPGLTIWVRMRDRAVGGGER